MASDLELLKSILGASPDNDLVPVSTVNDEIGFTHKFYQQYYKGIKVEYATYASHSKNGNIETINGDFALVGNPATVPALNEEAALSFALKRVNAYLYSWQVPQEESFLKEIKKDLTATYYPKGEILICYDYFKTKSYRLAYKFAISASVPEGSSYVYVDAINGEIVAQQYLLFDVNTTTTVATKYNGAQTITTDQFLDGSITKYRLQETRGAASVSLQTFNSQQVDNTFHIDFTDADNTWTASDNTLMDNAALDAHWATEKIFDYWSMVRGRNSYNTAGSPLPMVSFVHFNQSTGAPNGIPQYNKGWDDSTWDGNNQIVKLGDGLTHFKPLTSLDVCAHEFGHGFTQFASLTPFLQILVKSLDHPEALAINEGISDIWGAVIENWATTGKQTWRIGEDVMKDGRPCLRSLEKPKTDGDNATDLTPTGGYPDTYKKTFWLNQSSAIDDKTLNSFGHTNSTIMSHWFYLLSQGGSGKNELTNSYNVSGIGITKAANIVWRAEQNYLNANSEFADARNAMISAALDLYCPNSPEVAAVTNAWYAVGVGDAFSSPVMSIAGSGLVCPSTSYSISNLTPAGAYYTWSSSNPSVISINASSGVASAQSGSGAVTISANFGSGCSLSRTASIGVPPTIDGSYNNGQPMAYTPYPSGGTVNYNSVCAQTYISTSMTITGAASGTWQLISANPTSGITWSQSGNDITFYFSGSSQTARFRFTALNTCGSVSNDYYFQSTNCGGGGGGCLQYTVSPNPSSSTMSVASPSSPSPCGTSTSATTLTMSDLSIQSVSLYSVSDGQLKYTQQFPAGTQKVDLDVSGLKNGVYALQISSGTYNEVHRVVVSK